MSGICGVWAFDGAELELDPIMARLERRGPDGASQRRNGPVALGHTLLATTPEALVERLPLTDATSGCTITADVRLDNREELIAALEMGHETRVVGDGELILLAYLKWGENCPTHLVGDFAFALWDAGKEQLFCARDHMGMRQLIYHHEPGKLFAFATEIEALVGHPGVPKRINEGRIADFLDNLEGIDFTSTFCEEVFRLPPAHTLVVEGDSLTLRRYWTLEPEPELKLDSDQDYTDAFLRVFTEAVRCRLRGVGPVGSMLSGGLDSSSVAAVAGNLMADGKCGPLPTFSAVGPDSATCIESRSIRSVLSDPNLVGTTVDYSNLGPYRDVLARSVEMVEDPFDGQMNLVRAVYLAAHQAGVKVVLDGVAGDIALTNGNRIAQLLRGLRPDKAITEARLEAQFWGLGHRPLLLLFAAAWAGLVPKQLRHLRQEIIARRQDRAAMAGKSALTSKFAYRVGFDRRRRQFRQALDRVSSTGTDYQLRMITHPHTAAARERYDRIASAFAIEPRDPLLDIRLLRFALSLPRAQLQSNGWTKVILRRAMTGLLPDDVAWRFGKDHLGGHFARELIRSSPTWVERWKQVAPRLVGIASDVDMGREGHNRAPIDLDAKNFIELFSLGCWLLRNDVQKQLVAGD